MSSEGLKEIIQWTGNNLTEVLDFIEFGKFINSYSISPDNTISFSFNGETITIEQGDYIVRHKDATGLNYNYELYSEDDFTEDNEEEQDKIESYYPQVIFTCEASECMHNDGEGLCMLIDDENVVIGQDGFCTNFELD